MHTIRLDVKDSVFDKVMFLLRSLPKNEVQLKVEKKGATQDDKDNIVDFFQNSPLYSKFKSLKHSKLEILNNSKFESLKHS